MIAIQKQRATWHRSLYIRNSDLYRPRYLVKRLLLGRAAIFIQRPRNFRQDLGSLLKAFWPILLFQFEVVTFMLKRTLQTEIFAQKSRICFAKIRTSSKGASLWAKIFSFAAICSPSKGSGCFAKIFLFCPRSFLTSSAANIPKWHTLPNWGNGFHLMPLQLSQMRMPQADGFPSPKDVTFLKKGAPSKWRSFRVQLSM